MNPSLTGSIQWYKYRWLIVAILTVIIMSAAGIQEVHAEAKQVTSSSSSSSSSSFPDKKSVSSGNFTGIGQLIRVDDNTYLVDEGKFETLSKTASDSASQSGSASCGETVGSTIPGSISYSDGDGYTGSLSQTSYDYSDTTGTDCVAGGMERELGATWQL
jgi:hypothetical protein